MKIWPGSRHLVGVLFPFLIVVAVLLARQWYFTPDAETGEMAPNFTGRTLAGKAFDFADTRGQITLLHFWGSWCAPCRRQHPGLVRLARELGDDLQIVSVGIERDSTAWRAAIQRDDLFWPDHLLDATGSLRFLSGPISDLYGVNEVPNKFLIDVDGHVVIHNPEPDAIRQFVSDAR